MLNFIFLILPGLLAFSLLYGKKLHGKGLIVFTSEEIFKMLRDGILMIFTVNILGLYIGKRVLGVGETFVSGQLSSELLSLSYLVLITAVALIIGLGSRFIQGNFSIYFSKEKIKTEKDKGVEKLREK